MARRKVEDQYERIWREIKSLRLPLLTLDRGWYALFGQNKPKEIAKLEEELNEIVKSQGRIKEQKQKLNALKKKLMQDIINNMNASEESVEFLKMQKRRDLIEEINDRLILLEDEELDIPEKMREKNAELVMETMDIFYGNIADDLEEIGELERWIDHTRRELKHKCALYEQKVRETKNITHYFDNLLGSKLTHKYVNYLNGVQDEDEDYEDEYEEEYEDEDEEE